MPHRDRVEQVRGAACVGVADDRRARDAAGSELPDTAHQQTLHRVAHRETGDASDPAVRRCGEALALPIVRVHARGVVGHLHGRCEGLADQLYKYVNGVKTKVNDRAGSPLIFARRTLWLSALPFPGLPDMQEFTIKITVEEANIIAMGLGKLPLEMSVALWQKLREQVQQQSSLTPPETTV